jgi:putative membrane protein insertion efficiency factor
MKKIVITLIRTYQAVEKMLGPHKLPLLFSSGCRSWPTCSDYTVEAVQRRGVVLGLWSGVVRVAKCNPL